MKHDPRLSLLALKIGLLAALGSSLAAQSKAQDGFPISTDRPSYSDASSLIPLGRWQIETGGTYYRAGGLGFGTVPELLVRYPLSDRFELRLVNVNFGLFEGARGNGLQDPGVGFKLRLSPLNRPKGTPELALVGLVQAPWGADNLRADRGQTTAKLAWSLPIGAVDTIGGNVVVSDLSPRGTRYTQTGLSLYEAHTFSPRLASFVEVYGLGPVSPAGPNAAFADAGLTYLVNRATQIDLRYGTGFDQRRDGWFVGAGVSFRF